MPNGWLKNPRDADKWSSLGLCFSVRGMSVNIGIGLYLCNQMGQITFSYVEHRDIALGINIEQYKPILNV